MDKLFDQNDLETLKKQLPGKYYHHFERIWKEKFPGKKAPIRQSVYAVLSGTTENDDVIEVLTELAQRRKDLKTKLKKLNAEEQEASE